MKLKYDHAYAADPGHQFHSKLHKLGFIRRRYQVEHPGSQFCRFLSFRESMSELPTYLEFIDARDPKKPIRCPGLSLRATGPLEKFYKNLKGQHFTSVFEHKNYDWKKDSKSRLPGWNFVFFKKLGFRGLFPWITEYEPLPGNTKKKKRIPIQRHPNGVRRIVAIEIGVNKAGKRFFSKLLGKDLSRPVRLSGGQTLYFTAAKSTRMHSIILESKSLKQTRKFIRDAESTWRGSPALEIKNPSGMWNLLIVESRR